MEQENNKHVLVMEALQACAFTPRAAPRHFWPSLWRRVVWNWGNLRERALIYIRGRG